MAGQDPSSVGVTPCASSPGQTELLRQRLGTQPSGRQTGKQTTSGRNSLLVIDIGYLSGAFDTLKTLSLVLLSCIMRSCYRNVIDLRRIHPQSPLDTFGVQVYHCDENQTGKLTTSH